VVVIQTPNNNKTLHPKHPNPASDQEIDHESEPSDSSKKHLLRLKLRRAKSAVQTVRPGAKAIVDTYGRTYLFYTKPLNSNNINPASDQEIDHESEPSNSSKKHLLRLKLRRAKSAVQTVRPGAYAHCRDAMHRVSFPPRGQSLQSRPELAAGLSFRGLECGRAYYSPGPPKHPLML